MTVARKNGARTRERFSTGSNQTTDNLARNPGNSSCKSVHTNFLIRPGTTPAPTLIVSWRMKPRGLDPPLRKRRQVLRGKLQKMHRTSECVRGQGTEKASSAPGVGGESFEN